MTLQSKKQLQESTGPGRWAINAPGNGTHLDFPVLVSSSTLGANLRTNTIDVQSDLMGLTRNLNRDTINKNIHSNAPIPHKYNIQVINPILMKVAQHIRCGCIEI